MRRKKERMRFCAFLMAVLLLVGSLAADVMPWQVYAAEQTKEGDGQPAGESDASADGSGESAGRDAASTSGNDESAGGDGASTSGNDESADGDGASADEGDDDVPAGEDGAPTDEGTPAVENGDAPDTVSSSDITAIAAVKTEKATGKEYTVKGTVIFVDAANNYGQNIYVQDATGGIDLYFPSGNIPTGVAAGSVLTAKGKFKEYNKLFELEQAQLVGSAEAGDGTLPEAKVCTIAEVNEDYGSGSGSRTLQSTRVRIENAKIGKVNTSGNTALTQNGATINIYKCPALTGIDENANVNVEAVVGAYNAVQLRVVKAEDVTLSGTTETGDSQVDMSVTIDYAQWLTTSYSEEVVQLKSENPGGADRSAYLTLCRPSAESAPVFKPSDTSTTYSIGSQGLGSSGNEGHYQFVLSPAKKYGAYTFSLEMKGSNTGAKEWALSYSTDNTAYTLVQTFSIDKASTVQSFSAELPSAANGSEKLYLRLTPGTKSINNGTTGTGGTNYLSGIKLTAHPIVSDDICKPVAIKPAGGAVPAGQELTLSTAATGAKIYYTINNGTETLYNESSKPKLTAELLQDGEEVKVTAYAKADGKADSVPVKVSYGWAQVETVKATPNGGSVSIGKEVSLTCDTEGAKIQYSADDGGIWQDCEGGRLVLDKLPVTYLVKAVKEGYKDSIPVTLSYTKRTNEKYNIYFGQLHSHTSYSDGAGTCEEAFQHASEAPNLDFLAVTDHSNSFDNEKQANILDGSMSTEWTEGHQLADQYTKDGFVGLFGYEMTWSNGLGHMNTFNSAGFQSRTQTEYSTYGTALQNYYAALKKAPDSISQFNHPGTTFGDFSDYAHYDAEIDKLITTVEVGNGEGAIGSSGYFPSYEYYQRALDKGWHVAPTNNQDNHKGLWGDANTGRSVALADSLTRENIYDAMRNYRMYATEDNDLQIYYTLDGYDMGSILEAGQTGEQIRIKVDLSDATDARAGSVSVITNGGIVLGTKEVSAGTGTAEFTLANDYSYYYIKVVQPDGDIAVTAPVWVGQVEAAGINKISTSEVLPVKGQALPVTLELYNNEAADLELTSIEFAVKDKTVHKADLSAAGLSKVAPMSTDAYTFDYTHDGVGAVEIGVTVNAALRGVAKVYKGVLKLNYSTPEMVTKVLIDGTHYNDYVTGYYGANVGNFTAIAGEKSVKVEVVKDQITPKMLKDCALLIISAPGKKTGTANAGAYGASHFSDDFIAMVKEYTDGGGTLIVCGIADYQDSTDVQSAAEINKLLGAIGATTKINSDEAYDADNNGGQQYRLYLKNFKKDSRYLANAVPDRTGADGKVTEGQKYSAYSGCTVQLDEAAVASGKAEKLVWGYETTYSIDCKDEQGKSVTQTKDDKGNVTGPVIVPKGQMTALAHETLGSGANVFVAGTVFISDFEVKAELDNAWDLPYLNRTIVENILDEVRVALPATSIREVREKGKMGDVYAIEGYVTAGTSVEGNAFFDAIYVQDDTAGITIFPYSVKGLEIGTKIRITGYVDAYQGDKELQVMGSEILKGAAKHVYEPAKLSAKDAMDYEKSGGRLVQVSGKVTEVLYDKAGSGVSQFWLDDGSGKAANIFIDGYILSASTGKNELASIVKKGNTVSAAGLVYAHPEGASDVAVTCLRVRNCDEVTLVAAASDSGGSDTSTASPKPAATSAPTAAPRPAGPSAPAETPKPVETPVPTVTPKPVETPEPTEMPVPTATHKPVETPGPAEMPVPAAAQKPVKAPKPVEMPKPAEEDIAAVLEQAGTAVKVDMAKVQETVMQAKEGTTVQAEVTAENNTFKADVQAAIVGRDITVEFILESGITWIINGKNLKEGQREDIKLNVEYGGPGEVAGATIQASVLDAIPGAESCKIAVLDHDGDFFGAVQLKFPVEKESAGKYANLYYYNEKAEQLEFQESVKVDGEGMALFTFTHASQYVITVTEEAVREAAPEDEGNRPSAPSTGEDAPAVLAAADVKAGGMSAGILAAVAACGVGICVLVLLLRGRRRDDETGG